MKKEEAINYLNTANTILVVFKGSGYCQYGKYPKFKIVAVFNDGYCLEISIEEHPYYNRKSNLYHMRVWGTEPIFALFNCIDKQAYSNFVSKIIII